METILILCLLQTRLSPPHLPRSNKYLEKWVNTVGVVGFMANLHLGVEGSS